ISHAVYLSVNRSGENCINRLHRNFLSLPYTRNQHSSKNARAFNTGLTSCLRVIRNAWHFHHALV
ncbi:hypothetical protein, partial [Vibrio parahaemolyticus]|uniref:hypothetical protein n=1 Tax=Vibrio parahaemolyticus TaxID=670 RepID=UPI0030811952